MVKSEECQYFAQVVKS